MAVRDRLVVAVLAAGVLLGMAAWQSLTPWLGIAVVIAALTAGCAVYRFDLGSHQDGANGDHHPDDVVSEDELSTRRPSRARL